MAITYDYVIVGAGPSAMGVVYGLLESYMESGDFDSKSLPFSIAIVERGFGPPHDETTRDPRRWYEASHKKKSESVELIPSNMTGRSIDIPVGKGLGGTANVNACFCMPPLERDFDTWEKSWPPRILSSVDTLLETMKSNGSVLPVSDESMSKSFGTMFTNEAVSERIQLAEVSYLVKKASDASDDGCEYTRTNHFHALIEPLMQKFPQWNEQISWYRSTQAERVLLPETGNRITTVECMTSSGTFIELKAVQEIILCCGAIETPSLLLVSGIGGSADIYEGVGKNLVDQIILPRSCVSHRIESKVLSQNGVPAVGFIKQGSQTFHLSTTDASGHTTILPAVLPLSLRSSSIFDSPSIPKIVTTFFDLILKGFEFMVYSALKYTLLGFCFRYYTTGSLLILLDPKSKGSVSVSFGEQKREIRRRSDASISVNVGYLEDPRDVEALRQAWDVCGSIQRESCREIFPLPLKYICDPIGVDWFKIFCNHFSQSYFHYSGTCAMQDINNTDDWVVDRDLKLRGYDGLRICDASVFPVPISNPPALTCAALGHSLGFSLRQNLE